MTDTDLRIIFDKLRQFEENLKKLEKEIQEMKFQRYGNCFGDIALLDTVGSDNCKSALGYTLSSGDLSNTGYKQEWRVATENDDVEG